MQSQDNSEPPFDIRQLEPASCIKTTVYDIRRMHTLGASLQDIREKHSAFTQRYPKLVEKLMEPDMNEAQLKYLLKMFENVQQERTTFEHASQTIGKKMFDTFVSPDLTPEQRQRIQNKIADLQTCSPEELAQAAAQLGQQTMMRSSTTTTTTKPTRKEASSDSAKGCKKKLRKKREQHQD